MTVRIKLLPWRSVVAFVYVQMKMCIGKNSEYQCADTKQPFRGRGASPHYPFFSIHFMERTNRNRIRGGEENDVIILNEIPHPSIFPDVTGVNKSKLKITNVGKYSVSKKNDANFLVHLLKKYFKTTHITVTDANGNIGGNTISFALAFDKVNSIELNPTEFSVLENNVGVYGLKNVTLISGDSTNEIKRLKQDCVFIDAPWGGKNYLESDSMRLFMSELEISDIFNQNKQYAKLFVFKVPINYDFNYFFKNTGMTKYYIHSYEHHGKIKYHFIFAPTS